MWLDFEGNQNLYHFVAADFHRNAFFLEFAALHPNGHNSSDELVRVVTSDWLQESYQIVLDVVQVLF